MSADRSPRVPEEVREAVQRGEEDHRGELHSRGGSEGERVRTFEGQQHLRSCYVGLLETERGNRAGSDHWATVENNPKENFYAANKN